MAKRENVDVGTSFIYLLLLHFKQALTTLSSATLRSCLLRNYSWLWNNAFTCCHLLWVYLASSGDSNNISLTLINMLPCYPARSREQAILHEFQSKQSEPVPSFLCFFWWDLARAMCEKAQPWNEMYIRICDWKSWIRHVVAFIVFELNSLACFLVCAYTFTCIMLKDFGSVWLSFTRSRIGNCGAVYLYKRNLKSIVLEICCATNNSFVLPMRVCLSSQHNDGLYVLWRDLCLLCQVPSCGWTVAGGCISDVLESRILCIFWATTLSSSTRLLSLRGSAMLCWFLLELTVRSVGLTARLQDSMVILSSVTVLQRR